MKNFEKEKKDIRKFIKDFKCGTIKMFKELFNKNTFKNQIANLLSFIRLISPLIIIPLSVVGAIGTIPSLLITAGIVTIVSSTTDCVDGAIARKLHTTSEYGKLLDQITDKVFAALIGINLAILNPTFIIPIIGEAIIGSTNLYYNTKYNNLENKSTLLGKIKTWPLFALLGIGYFCPINDICSTIANIIIPILFSLQLAVTGSYIKENERQIKKNNIINEINLESTDENKSTLELELNNTPINTNNNTIINVTKPLNRIDEYKKLKEVLKQILELKTNNTINENINTDEHQKKII